MVGRPEEAEAIPRTVTLRPARASPSSMLWTEVPEGRSCLTNLRRPEAAEFNPAATSTQAEIAAEGAEASGARRSAAEFPESAASIVCLPSPTDDERIRAVVRGAPLRAQSGQKFQDAHLNQRTLENRPGAMIRPLASRRIRVVTIELPGCNYPYHPGPVAPTRGLFFALTTNAPPMPAMDRGGD